MGRRERERKIGLCPGRCLSAVCLVLASCLLMAGCGAQAGTEEKEEAAPFHVTALKVGKADALLLWTEGEAVLLDAGEDDDGEEVLEYIEEQGIDSLKAMIITHFDKDHVGGADKILEGCPVETVYYPDYEGDGKQYRQFCEALEASGAAGDGGAHTDRAAGGGGLPGDLPVGSRAGGDSGWRGEGVRQ